MDPLWLLLIVPFSASIGVLLMALVIANDGAYIDIDGFRDTLEIYAEHLREQGEETAAQAVETILKSVNRGVFG